MWDSLKVESNGTQIIWIDLKINYVQRESNRIGKTESDWIGKFESNWIRNGEQHENDDADNGAHAREIRFW